VDVTAKERALDRPSGTNVRVAIGCVELMLTLLMQ